MTSVTENGGAQQPNVGTVDAGLNTPRTTAELIPGVYAVLWMDAFLQQSMWITSLPYADLPIRCSGPSRTTKGFAAPVILVRP